MEKLTFEPLTAAHGAELLPLWQDEAVVRYTNMALPCTPEEAARRAEVLAPFDVFVLRLEGELAGIAGCPAADRAERRFGVFYQLRPAFWGRGLGTRAVGRLLDFMAENMGRSSCWPRSSRRIPPARRSYSIFSLLPGARSRWNGTENTTRCGAIGRPLCPPRNRREGTKHWRTADSADRPLTRRPPEKS